MSDQDLWECQPTWLLRNVHDEAEDAYDKAENDCSKAEYYAPRQERLQTRAQHTGRL